MRKVVFIILFLFFVSDYVDGQEDMPLLNYERKTFELYSQKNWSELIYWGKKAIKDGNDYFYMRMRLGIAFFERKNYHRALIHFQKAAEFNDDDTYLLEYLYFANLYSNREKAAYCLTKKFPSSMKRKYVSGKIPKFKLGSLGMQLNFSNFQAGPEDITGISPELNGYQVFSNNLFKANLGFNHLISPRFSLFYQYGFMVENRFTYYQKDLQGYYMSNQKLYQHQFYILGNIYLGGGFNMYTSLHYLPGRLPDYYVGTSGGWGGYSYVPAYKYNDFTGHISLVKDFPYISLGLSGSFSYLNFNTYLQEGLLIQFYPLGNLNLYLTSGFHIQQELTNTGIIEKGQFTELKLGFKIFNPVWLEFSGAFGDLHYTTTQMGWQVFNGPNPIDQQIGASILIPVGKKNALFRLNFNYYNTTSSFTLTDTGEAIINTTDYNIYSIFGGLSWKF